MWLIELQNCFDFAISASVGNGAESYISLFCICNQFEHMRLCVLVTDGSVHAKERSEPSSRLSGIIVTQSKRTKWNVALEYLLVKCSDKIMLAKWKELHFGCSFFVTVDWKKLLVFRKCWISQDTSAIAVKIVGSHTSSKRTDWNVQFCQRHQQIHWISGTFLQHVA